MMMFLRPLKNRLFLVFSQVARWGSQPGDDEHTRLNKALIVGASVLFIPAGWVWAAGYFGLGLPLAGALPLSASFILLVSLLYYLRTHRYSFLLWVALTQTLFMPAALSIALGGFVNSGLVILWSALAPFAALILEDLRSALGWFVAFLAVIGFSAWLQPQLPYIRPLPESLVMLSFVMNLGNAFVITFITAAYFVAQKEIFKARSEALLLNILPPEIAEILKEKPRHIAQTYPQASVLFADIVNFTPLSASLSAGEVVDMLNDIFSAFDVITKKHGLEKIKTIGDCYMAAAGVPRPRADHAEALASAALEMQAYMRTHTFYGRSLQIRAGIHSGEVVAGVIGRDKFIYDLWGDTVNTASRMESHGLPDTIQVTAQTASLLPASFHLKRRGVVRVKGKGAVEVHFLTGKSSPENL